MWAVKPRTALGIALAIGVGVAGAVLLFPGATTPEPAPIQPTEVERSATVRRGLEAGREVEVTRKHEVSADLAERRSEPAARHAAVDAAKWRRVAQVLDEAGDAVLAERARAMAGELDRALHPTDDVALDEMLIDERRFIFEIRSSPMFPKVEDEIGLIELGLNAAQQAGVHPADQVR